MKPLSRRDFLKLSALSIGSLALSSFAPSIQRVNIPFPFPQDDSDYATGEFGRVGVSSISVFNEPKMDSTTVGYRFRDDLLNIYYEIAPASGPAYNPLWYRIWGGYVHSAYIQRVKVRFNSPLTSVSTAGQLCEVTVPWTQIYQYDRYNGWTPQNRLYNLTTHWAVGVDEGPDKQPWYRLYDELLEIEYHVPAYHLRPIPDKELAPISPDVPWEKKRIEVRIQEQMLLAYEGEQIVFQTKISSGIHSTGPSPNGIPTDTPKGAFNVQSKMPSKHMGDGRLTGDTEAYTLPGVPWTCFFLTPPGNAFHGAYWHNNFGLQMSHGCVNMRIEEAKWLFLWCDPKFEVPVKERTGWEKRGYGTQVHVI